LVTPPTGEYYGVPCFHHKLIYNAWMKVTIVSFRRHLKMLPRCPFAKPPRLRDTSSLDTPHLGAPANDPVVKPSRVDRLSKRMNIVVWWGDT
jgi:hypothetical protein